MPLDYRQTLVNLMGVASDASDEILNSSISDFQTSMCQYKELTDSQIVGLESQNATLSNSVSTLTSSNEKLTNSNKTLLTAVVDVDIKNHASVISDEKVVREMLMNDRESGLKMLNSLKLATPAAPVVAPVAKPAPLHNASTAAQPAPIVNGGGTQTTPEFAIKVTNRARELQNSSKGMGWNQAFLNARAEIESELQTA